MYMYILKHVETCENMRTHAETCDNMRKHGTTCEHMRKHAKTCTEWSWSPGPIGSPSLGQSWAHGGPIMGPWGPQAWAHHGPIGGPSLGPSWAHHGPMGAQAEYTYILVMEIILHHLRQQSNTNVFKHMLSIAEAFVQHV